MTREFCVLQLSDIHIKGIEDHIFDAVDAISGTIFHDARDTGVCLVLVSGDIAFSGAPDEYLAAELFLSELKNSIRNEGCSVVEILTVPGNHDCALIENDSTRDIVIDHIVNAGAVDLSENLVEKCVEVQGAFFDFRESLTNTNPVHDHPLWTEYEFNVNSMLIRISALNAAWMSRLPEKNGELVYPISDFESALRETADVRMAMLHHPLHWYESASFHALRDKLHIHCDFVLSGHEHTQATVQSNLIESGHCTVVECGALQPHGGKSRPEFLTLRIDASNNVTRQRRFRITAEGSAERFGSEEYVTQVGGDKDCISCVSEEFQHELRDPGGKFLHPRKTNLSVDDFFIYPVVTDRMDQVMKGVSTEQLIKKDTDRERILFIGDEKSGKTTLLRRAFRDWHVQGFLPVLVRGADLKSRKSKEYERAVNRAAKNQYADFSQIESAPRDRRMILIDDIDMLSGGHSALRPLLEYCDKHFSRILVSATSGYEFAELVDSESPEAISSFDVFSLPTFGHKMRRRLIKKWFGRGSGTDEAYVDRLVHDVETVMNTVIGNGLVPANPMFLLILLQSIDQGHEQDLHHSGLAHYYHYLITRGLGSAGISPEEIDEIFNYLAHLAWIIQSNDDTEISIADFEAFNEKFSDRFVSVDSHARVESLERAKILSRRAESISFAYPYLRYFFVGKYLADNSGDSEVLDLVNEYCDSLHARDRANCILFLMHHRNDLHVAERLSSQLATCFAEYAPLRLREDTCTLNDLIDSSTELMIGDIDLEENQERERDIRDRYDEHDDKNKDSSGAEEIDEAIDASARINYVLRTAEILGQVLKSYYGSIERNKKAEFVEAVFDGPLRMLRFLIEDIIEDPEGFAAELHQLIRKNKPSSARMPTEKQTRKFAFDLIGMICTGVVSRTARLVNSEKLEEDLDRVSDDRDSVSYRLIAAAARLTKPGSPDFAEIQRLSKDLRDNSFAFRILQSLGYYHLRMFHTDEPEKQKLCAALKINRQAAPRPKGPPRRRELPFPVRNLK